MQWRCSIFSVFEQKYLFWANLVQQIKIVSLRWNLIPRLIRLCRIQWWCSFFSFSTVNTLFWANFVQKNQNCQFMLKFGIKTSLNMKNSMVMFTFSVFYWKRTFGASLVQKVKIVSLSWNFVDTCCFG